MDILTSLSTVSFLQPNDLAFSGAPHAALGRDEPAPARPLQRLVRHRRADTGRFVLAAALSRVSWHAYLDDLRTGKKSATSHTELPQTTRTNELKDRPRSLDTLEERSALFVEGPDVIRDAVVENECRGQAVDDYVSVRGARILYAALEFADLRLRQRFVGPAPGSAACTLTDRTHAGRFYSRVSATPNGRDERGAP
jgi:hypothetical protein